jgi:hypothetical protein
MEHDEQILSHMFRRHSHCPGDRDVPVVTVILPAIELL